MIEYFNKLKLIFMGILSMQIIYFFAAVFLIQSQGPLMVPSDNILISVAIAFGGMALLASRSVRSRFLSTAKAKPDAEGKKTGYLITLIIHMALLEAANLLNITAYLLTGDKFLLGMILLLLIFAGSQKPGPVKFRIDMGLDQKEFDQMFTSIPDEDVQ